MDDSLDELQVNLANVAVMQVLLLRELGAILLAAFEGPDGSLAPVNDGDVAGDSDAPLVLTGFKGMVTVAVRGSLASGHLNLTISLGDEEKLEVDFEGIGSDPGLPDGAFDLPDGIEWA